LLILALLVYQTGVFLTIFNPGAVVRLLGIGAVFRAGCCAKMSPVVPSGKASCHAIVLHAFLLGFVFSMIFGHATIIIPALTGVQLNYSPIFYGHLILLHPTLVYRMYGNLAEDFSARQWGGLLNTSAVLLFMAIMAVTVFRSNIDQRSDIRTMEKATSQ
jgi:hypothetical protein